MFFPSGLCKIYRAEQSHSALHSFSYKVFSQSILFPSPSLTYPGVNGINSLAMHHIMKLDIFKKVPLLQMNFGNEFQTEVRSHISLQMTS